MRGAKGFACCAHKIAFERFLGRERKRVKHQIKPVSLAAHTVKKCFDLLIARYVAWKQRRLFAKFADELFDVLFQSLALIIKNQFRARVCPRFRNRPRDAALVRHAEHDTYFSGQILLGHSLQRYAALKGRKKHSSASQIAPIVDPILPVAQMAITHRRPEGCLCSENPASSARLMILANRTKCRETAVRNEK